MNHTLNEELFKRAFTTSFEDDSVRLPMMKIKSVIEWNYLERHIGKTNNN